jgi:hypothetical protein
MQRNSFDTPTAWYYQADDSMREVCWTAEEAEALRAKGYELHELYGNPWRPISEAPRDGTPVYLCSRGRVLPDRSWKSHGNLNGKPRPESWEPYSRGRIEPDPTHFMWPPRGPDA